MSNVLDISNWQRGINLSAIPDLHGVVVKATQGSDYASPSWPDQIRQVLDLGLLPGAYHYVGGQGIDAEATKFVSAIQPYLGRVLVCLDWEDSQNVKWGDVAYLQALAREVMSRTGVKKVCVYCSRSSMPWSVIDAEGGVSWMARYASNEPVFGWQATPWAEGDPACDIRQYTGRGRLPGWAGDLDLDKCYMTAEEWMEAASVGEVQPVPTPVPPDTSLANIPLLTLVADTMSGRYGAGDERREMLGSRWREVQDAVNHVYDATAEQLADEVWAGRWGNGSMRKAALGRRYGEVMAAVNGSRTYTVVKGDTLSGIGAKLGVKWQTIATKNGIAAPYTIYAGQRLTY